MFSATISIEGENVDSFTKAWIGTIQWTAQSPYRIYHKRKNWFVGISSFTVPDIYQVDEKQIEYQTLRASGPGGQHVNKTESAVRAVHIPSGLSVTSSELRSQVQNKKLALERLLIKLAAWETEKAMQLIQDNWNKHNSLQRGNPVLIFKEPLIP